MSAGITVGYIRRSRTYLLEPFMVGGVGSDGCGFAESSLKIPYSARSAGIDVVADLID